MSSNKQRKAVARAKYESYLERKAAQARRHRRNQFIVGGVVIAAIVAGAALWAGGAFDDEPPAAAEPAATPTTKPPTFKRPDQVLTPGKPATVTFATDRGQIQVALATDDAPKNSNSLAFLAKQGYFDNTACHRLTTGETLSVLQCGDPTGDGSGGPGYTVADENLPKAGTANYPAGTVAMAEPPGGDAGSQFFLVYQDSTLPPDYTIVGHISDGLDVIKQVAKAGVTGGSADGPPVTPVTIESVTVDQA